MVMLKHCSDAGTNIDRYVIGMKRYADETGIDTSASMVMELLTPNATVSSPRRDGL
jgi:hypothetical protein